MPAERAMNVAIYPVDLPWKNGMPASSLETSTDELRIAA